jgi:pyruvate dehydrogenase E2 component (dihydrolipoamide acetyltransferase)
LKVIENTSDTQAVQHVEISRVLATPFVRQMARGMKIDIQQVKVTGPVGRVTENDLQQYVEKINKLN